MAHVSWDIPNRLLSLLKGFGAQADLGFGLELLKRRTKKVHLPWRWVWVRQDGSCLCVARMTAMHSGLLPKIIFCSETLKVVMAPEKWLWWQGQRESIGGKEGRGENLSTQLRLLYNIKFGNWTRDIWSTCSLFPPLISWSVNTGVGFLVVLLRNYVNYYCLYSGIYLLFWYNKDSILLYLVTCKRSRTNTLRLPQTPKTGDENTAPNDTLIEGP